MTFHYFKRFVVLARIMGLSLLCVLVSAEIASAEALDSTINEQVIMLSVTEHGNEFQFETTIFKPPGNGPFPLLLMNHGKEIGDPHKQKRDRFLAISREFVKRGYSIKQVVRASDNWHASIQLPKVFESIYDVVLENVIKARSFSSLHVVGLHTLSP